MAGDGGGAWRIPLAATDLDEAEIAAVTRVLRGGWLTMGPVTEEFEHAFAARLGVRHALAVSSGTAALHLAHLALGIGPGHEVICPTLTFVATANAARYVGADVVLADVVGPDDLTVSPSDIERKITPRTKAISVLHYAGFPCRMDAIVVLARRHGLRVIEDCAHAPLAVHVAADGSRRHVGAIGDVGCFSFFGNKNMTTGEGGMVTTGDDALAARMRRLRSHGMTSLSHDRHRGRTADDDVVELGHNFRLDDLRSAIGLVQLGKLEGFHRRRREVWRWYAESLRGSRAVRLPFCERDLEAASPHVLPLVVFEDVARLRLRLHANGIQTSRHYPPVGSLSVYRGTRGETPVADALPLVTLPFGQHLTPDQVRQIAALVA